MALRSTGTVAIVTGAGSGIGAAAARRLAKAGASVALVARRKDRLLVFGLGLDPLRFTEGVLERRGQRRMVYSQRGPATTFCGAEAAANNATSGLCV